MRAAAVQLNSTGETDRNRRQAESLVRAAADDGAALVVLPEKWNALGGADVLAAGAEPLDGPTVAWARELARELGVDLVAGSIVEHVEGREKRANTSLHVGPDGEIRAVYRKIHLFDVDVGGRTYRESDGEDPGTDVVVSSLADGTPLGMTVCYDVRFPELYRALADRGARVVAIPSAFTRTTTRAHWEVLVRARAIEDACFVIAANQVGDHPGLGESGGRSLIVDPWGEVLARGSEDGVEVVAADLDLERVEAVRAQSPSLTHRHPEVYA
jgi:deaminated glutathione amidase